MKEERSTKTEPFLERWSRLKREAASAPPVTAPAQGDSTPPPPLPPLETLSFDSDFRGFLHAKVEEGLRRTALKKLFGDPRFNTIDPLDIYIDDYTIPDPIPPEMLKNLTQYQTLFASREEERPGEQEAGTGPIAEAGEESPAALPQPASEGAEQGVVAQVEMDERDKMTERARGPSQGSGGVGG